MNSAVSARALDPGTLADDVERLVSVGLVVQAHALAVARQQSAATFIADDKLANRVRDGQDDLGDNARFYLNRLLPAVTGTLADAGHAANVVGGLGSAVADPAAARNLPAVAAAVLAQLAECRDRAIRLADDLTDRADQAQATTAALTDLLTKQITALDGPDGEIARTRHEIGSVRAALDADLAGIVKGSRAVGSGVRAFLTDKVKLVTGMLTTFGGDRTEKSGFSLEAVDIERADDTGGDTAASGAEEVEAAVAAFGRNNAALADLYQRLYRQSAALAVAGAICDQVGAYAKAMRLLVTAARNVATTWGSVLDASATVLDAHPEPPDITAALSGSSTAWAALTDQLGHARAALAGRRGVIPNVGPLPVRT